jgi:hypothetical protein
MHFHSISHVQCFVQNAALHLGLEGSNPGFSLTPLAAVQINARFRMTVPGGGNSSELF